VEVITKFEDNWILAEKQLLEKEKLHQLNNFSWLLVDTGHQYDEFKE
jgi:hypothetical protein